MIVEIGSDWRDWQREQWPAISRARTSVLVVHRGAGKTIMACMRLLGWALERSNSTSAYIGPQQTQVRKFVWPLMKRLYAQVPGCEFFEQEMRVDLPGGSRLFVLGAENAHAIRGATLDGGVILDEIAQIGPLAYGQVIYPAMTRPGVEPRCLIIGTPLGMSNLFYQLFQRAASTEGWYRALLPVDATGLYTPEEVARLKAEMDPGDYAQEMECSFSAAVRGAFYAKEMQAADQQGRIGSVPYDPLMPVHTSWDLGIANRTVVWLWQLGSSPRAIGCRAYSGMGLPAILADLRTLPYVWGRHYAPHDAKVRELGSGVSRQEIAHNLGMTWEIVPEVGIQAGIEATKSLIAIASFDREKCGDGIEALQLYRTEWDDEKRVFSNAPLHDWTSDYADAARMFAVGYRAAPPRSHRKADYRAMDRMMGNG